MLLGVPSVAFSQQTGDGASFERSAAFAARLVETLLGSTPPRDVLLNVNFPAGAIQGVRFTKLGKRVYQQVVAEKIDPRGQRYFWIAGTPQWQEEEGTDHAAVSSGEVSITPLQLGPQRGRFELCFDHPAAPRPDGLRSARWFARLESPP